MKISVVLIVKNEQELLARCLESVKGADEIIVCDTGSADGTVEIAKKYTDKVFTDFLWCDDFAKARNHAKSKATGDWILSIDADEYLHDFKKVREAVEGAGEHRAINVTLICDVNQHTHLFPRLFKNIPEVQWVGAIHNRLNIPVDRNSGVEITYTYSPAHRYDPERTLRILEQEAAKPGATREMYYLGKEYLHYGRLRECISVLEKYTKESRFLPELADAFLIMSQAYWNMGEGDNARSACLQAINVNAHFKEAILWMGAISWDWNAEQWHRMAQTADNRNVLFVRVK